MIRYTNVTDRQTDRWTTYHSVTALCWPLRGKTTSLIVLLSTLSLY